MQRKCVNHPDAPAVADCKVCGTSVCLMCVEEVGEESYCSVACASTTNKQAAAEPGPETQAKLSIDNKKCQVHPKASAVAVCKVCFKPVCVVCVVEAGEDAFCSAECQQDLAAVSDWVTPADEAAPSPSPADISSTDKMLISGEESILEMGTMGPISAGAKAPDEMSTAERLLISGDESILDMGMVKPAKEPVPDALEENPPLAPAPESDPGEMSADERRLLIAGDESLLDMGAVRHAPAPAATPDSLEEGSPLAPPPPPSPAARAKGDDVLSFNPEPSPKKLDEVRPPKLAKKAPPLTYGPPDEEEEEDREQFIPPADAVEATEPDIELRPPPAPAAPPRPLPPAELVACMVCAKEIEKSSAIETSEGNLFCSFECSGQQMGVPEAAETAPEESGSSEPEAEPEPEPEANPRAKSGSKLHAVILAVAAVMVIVVGLVVMKAMQGTGAPPADLAKAKPADPVPPKAQPKADPVPPKAEPVQPKAQPKAEPVQPKPQPKAEPVQPKTEPVQPKPQPKTEPVQPKPQPKTEPVQPKPQPKTEPVQPKPQPVQPKPVPVAPKPVPAKPKAPKAEVALRMKKLLTEAGHLVDEATPVFKEVVDAADPAPAADDARRALEAKARAVRFKLERARDLYTACRDEDPLALDRRVSTIGGMMDALADAASRLR
jgi:hypothetical protein